MKPKKMKLFKVECTHYIIAASKAKTIDVFQDLMSEFDMSHQHIGYDLPTAIIEVVLPNKQFDSSHIADMCAFGNKENGPL